MGIREPADFKSTARDVSLTFVTTEAVFDESDASELVMHFGQFIDHDLALTPHLNGKLNWKDRVLVFNQSQVVRTPSGCGAPRLYLNLRISGSVTVVDGREEPWLTDLKPVPRPVTCGCTPTANCMPIPCTKGEPGPVCNEQSCIKFTRSRPVFGSHDICQYDWSFIPRTHPNVITSYLDASNVYGSHRETIGQLRSFEGGRMLMENGSDPNSEEHIHILPGDQDNNECKVGASNKECGKGGDIRAAEQPVLTSLHTLFANEHNRIAGKLYGRFPCLNDELLFQETRKIVIAIMQKIVYGEWLPLVIGQEAMEKYRLALWNPYDGYDQTIDATTSNEFGAVFFRFGHSMVPEQLKRVDPNWGDTHEDIDLKNAYFNATIVDDLGNGGINSLLLGTLQKRLLAIDRHHSASIHEHLFENISVALDLVALNIQRGRDHGVAPYVHYRKHCSLGLATSWEDLTDVMDPGALEALRQVYDDVEEIEPFVGMLAEKHATGALVGPTLACILGEQFHKLKHGDRYWFENKLDEVQLEIIKKVTMARVICDTVAVKEIQPAAFKLRSKDAATDSPLFYEMINTQAYPDKLGQMNKFVNARVACTNYEAIPRLDLSKWPPPFQKGEPEILVRFDYPDLYNLQTEDFDLRL